MKKLRTVAILISISSVLVATAAPEGVKTDAASANEEKAKQLSPEEARAKLRKMYDEKLGGFVTKPGSQKGCVRFVNAQKKLGNDQLELVVSNLRKQLKHDIAVIGGEAPNVIPTTDDLAKYGGTITIFVVDAQSYPPLIAAPEARWAIVNVGSLATGLKDDVLGRRLFARRARGELYRAFSAVCGGASSQYPGNIFNVPSIQGLDSLDVDSTVVDMISKYEAYLPTVGVTPPYTVTFSRAYVEGWAPSPTNEFQRAVVERIKAKKSNAPTKGLTIEYDPKEGR